MPSHRRLPTIGSRDRRVATASLARGVIAAVVAHLGCAAPPDEPVGVSRRLTESLVAAERAPESLMWAGMRTLAPSDGLSGDEFGTSVALSGDTALVGSPKYSGSMPAEGAAYVFTRSSSSWPERRKLNAPDSLGSDLFGSSVALAGSTAAIGAPGHPVTVNQTPLHGAVYVFEGSGASWTFRQKLTASNVPSADYFGATVAMDGDTLIAGAYASDNGSAFVYTRSGSTWTEQQQIGASDGAFAHRFGSSVSLSGNTALVGAVDANGTRLDQGAAYVFTRSGSVWTQQQKLLAADGATGDEFGYAVAVSGDTALVGAYYDSQGAETARGSAYVFTRSGTTWTQRQKLTASDGAGGDYFGFSVALSTDTALVTAVYHDTTDTNLGAGYVWRSGTLWGEWQKLVAPGARDDNFGWSSALSGETVLFGAPRVDAGDETNRGVAYVFSFGFLINGEACTTDTECASEHCVDGRCCNTACTGSCTACSVAEGATSDGACTVYPVGSPGSPSCGYLICNGTALDCTQCTGDTQCAAGRYCSAAGTCLPQRALGQACNSAAGADCLEASCRVCVTSHCDGTCVNCRTDTDCAHAQYCAADGTCVSRKSAGVACSTAASTSCRVAGCRVCADTASHCVDGVCCDGTCDGTCEACVDRLTGAADGLCAPVPADQDPENECLVGSGSCGADGSCDGLRACRAHARPGTACGATMCSGSTITGPSCDDAGACSMTPQSCAPYLCDGNACGTGCTDDFDCTNDGYCVQGGTCAYKRDHGEPCGAARECVTGFCADGRCCSTACDAECDTCSAADGATADGTCTALPVGTSCGTDLFCTGSGLDCTGCTTDAHCPASRHCTPSGTCLPRKGQGDACDDAGEDCHEAGCRVCETDHCIDGICCDRACSSVQACSADLKVSGGDGTCGEATTAVNGAPCTTPDTCTSGSCRDGVCCNRNCETNEACTEAMKVSGGDGTCGEARTAVNGSPCENEITCTSGYCADGVCCDVACADECMACAAALKQDGEDGTCGPVKVGTDPQLRCMRNAACPLRPTCSAEALCDCQPEGITECDEDGVTRINSDSTDTDCSPYRCDPAAGDCFPDCDTGAHCAPGARCTSDGECVSLSAPSAGEDGGCGCRMHGRTRGGNWVVLAVLGLTLVRRRSTTPARGGLRTR
jgi:hypothetical protein